MGALAPLVPTPMYRSGLPVWSVCLSGLPVWSVCMSGLPVWSVCLVCLSVCGGLNFIFALSAVCTNQVLICCLNIEFLYNVFILCSLLYLNGSLFYSLSSGLGRLVPMLGTFAGFHTEGGAPWNSPPPPCQIKLMEV